MDTWCREQCLTKDNLFNRLCVALDLSLFYLFPVVGVLLSLFLLFTPLAPALFLYFIWIYLDRNTAHQDGRRCSWIRSSRMHHHLREYFSSKIIKTADLPPNKNYILCTFPHGVLCTSALAQFLAKNEEFEKLYPGIEVSCHTLNSNFYFPFSREYALAIGFCSVSKEALVYQLSKPNGRAVCLIIGGSAESMVTSPGTHRIIAKNRKGFIKLALTTGSDLVPVYSFGENELYKQWIFPENSLIRKIQQAIRKFTGVAPVLIAGRGLFQNYFGFVPFSKPVHMIIGRPIRVEKVEQPTREQINKLHQVFLEEIQKLFEEYKHKYVENPESTHLSIED